MYALWLVPDAPAYEKLALLIEELSSTHGTPRFEPHVTLLSGIINSEEEAVEQCRLFASSQSILSAQLIEIQYLEQFYRCLFFKTDTNKALLQLRQQAEEQFAHTQVRPFVPHLSFLYGSLPKFKKESIIEQLGNRFFVNLVFRKIRLIEIRQRPEFWRVVADFPLSETPLLL